MPTEQRPQDAAAWLSRFAEALAAEDRAATLALFAPTAIWRDLLAFSWSIASFEGHAAIAGLIDATLSRTAPRDWAIDAPAGAQEGFISFATSSGDGNGYVRLVDGQCVTLLTNLHELTGFERPIGPRRDSGIAPTADDPRSWGERRADTERELGYDVQPFVAIVGGGQGGLALAARLKLLGVPALVLDRHPRIGDQWRSRYASLLLHDPVWYDHMPCIPFPDHWPIFTPKDKLGDWMECYARLMELDVWTGAEVRSASHDGATGRWTVEVLRDGRTVTISPDHLVLATGNAGFPSLPSITGAADFTGTQCHSSEHRGGEGLSGKSVVVIGANNSAHDICQDLVEHGAAVTMVQRSSTLVVRSQTFTDVMVKGLYSEEALARGITTDRADLIAASVPIRMLEQSQRETWAQIAAIDEPFYDRLRAAGFQLDFGEDDTGLHMKYLRRASGYYIDVGASDMIADGRIALARAEIDRIVADGVVLADGRVLPADAIIYATGFTSMESWAAQLISPEVAARVGKCWGYGSATRGDAGPWIGELRNMWKPTAQPGLWFMGGNLAQARFYSQVLALQLKARHAKLPVVPYDPLADFP